MPPKKNEPPAREPVTARGAALLALIAASASGFLMLTQDEGLEAVNAGHATVDPSITEGETAAVRLTDAGRAALAAPTGGAATGGAGANFAIDDGVPVPQRAARGRSGGYPFGNLQVGQSFHVPLGPDDETAADVATRLQSSVSGARTRFSEATGEKEQVSVKDYAKSPDGSFTKDANGKRVVTATRQVSRDKMRVTRDFTVKAVDASDPRGPGARVWRTA